MKLTIFVSSILAAVASLNAATITVGTQPLNFSAIKPVVLSNGGLILNGGGFVAIGATTQTDLEVGDIGTPLGFTAFQTAFSQFGTSTTFGGLGVTSEPSLFSFTTNNSTAINDDFVGKSILLVAGNNASLALSTELFVYEFVTAYGADGPLFTADVDLTQSGAVLFGGTQADITLPNAGVNSGFKMATVGVIPEPSALALSALGALALLRRRRD